MPAIVVLGAQWGDEGKGKIIDSLASEADIVVRFNGGANAGHTIVIGDKTYPIHLLPSGIFREGKMNLVGPGVVFDPNVGVQELKLSKQFGSHVMLDSSIQIVLPIHRLMDASRERAAGSSAIGTTLRGIGPTYSDFWLRRGLTLHDLRSPERIREVLLSGGYWKELFAIVSVLGGANIDFRELGMNFNPLHMDDTIDWCVQMGELLSPFLGDTRAYVHEALERNRHVLFEGAQGVMLDAYHGSRPFCTSSLCTAAGVVATFGVYKFERVIGVAKAYVTRVGAGPFPTELLDAKGEELRRCGHEFGTTTGRPRRCGWLDLAALRYACRVGSITQLVITKLDVISGIKDVRLCRSYENVGPFQTLTNDVLTSAKPILTEVPELIGDLSSFKTYAELPLPFRRYLRQIQNVTGVWIKGVGIGPERNQILWR